jgi:hypothetical protein
MSSTHISHTAHAFFNRKIFNQNVVHVESAGANRNSHGESTIGVDDNVVSQC